jgi:hypothetical protein
VQTCRKWAAGGVKFRNSVCGGRLWSAGRTGKPVPGCGNPSARPATQNLARPASPLLWCLGATDHGQTGTFGAVQELGRTADISRQKYRSSWRPWYWELVVSRAAGRWLTQERLQQVVAVLRCGQCVIGWWRSDGLDAREGVSNNVLSRDESYVRRKLGYKIQMTKLPR